MSLTFWIQGIGSLTIENLSEASLLINNDVLFSLGLRPTLRQCYWLRLESYQIWVLLKIRLFILLLKQDDSLVIEILWYQNGILAQLLLIGFLNLSSINTPFVIIRGCSIRGLILIKILLNEVPFHLIFIERSRLIVFWTFLRGEVVLD
jgi:hypothetical protein